MSDTALRLRLLRNRLCISQAQFGLIFTSQRKMGRPLEPRAISHWENGKAIPSHDQIVQLLDFLDDPDSWLELQGVQDNNPYIALRFLAWYDPKHGGLRYKSETPFLHPRKISGRRSSLEPLVYDILNLQEHQSDWEARLERCSRFSSRSPLKLLRFPGDVLRSERSQGLGRYRESILLDRNEHGSEVFGVLDPDLWFMDSARYDMVERREAMNELAEAAMANLDRFLHGRLFEKGTIKKWLTDISEAERFAFNLGVLMTSMKLTKPGQISPKERVLFETSASWHNFIISMAELRTKTKVLSQSHFEDFAKGAISIDEFVVSIMERIVPDSPESLPGRDSPKTEREEFHSQVMRNLARATPTTESPYRIVLLEDLDDDNSL